MKTITGRMEKLERIADKRPVKFLWHNGRCVDDVLTACTGNERVAVIGWDDVCSLYSGKTVQGVKLADQEDAMQNVLSAVPTNQLVLASDALQAAIENKTPLSRDALVELLQEGNPL